MEHITVETLPGNYKRLIPDQGYLILNTRTQQTYRQAVTKDTRPFRAIENI